jgi:hypothetical protein
MAIIWLVIKSK